MSNRYGAKITTDSLVLCLDAHDAKSYAGEPTTNVLVDNTGTSGMGWAGDGTNQSVGAKSSVSITDDSLKYNDYPTVLWTPGSSLNAYLNGSADIPTGEVSTEWTFSAYLKYEDGAPITSLSVYMYYPSSDGSAAGTIVDVGDGWYRVSRTRTGASNYIGLAGFTGFSSNKKVYISGWQLEKKQYATPFVTPATSRSATNGWVDRSPNGLHGTLTNMIGTEVAHYKKGQVIMPTSASYLHFDGTNDQVIIPSSGEAYSKFSLEFWIKINGAADADRFYSWNTSGTMTVRWRSSNYFDFHYNPLDGSPASTQINGNVVSDPSGWHHVVVTNDVTDTSTGAKIYTDGVLGGSGEPSGNLGNYGHILGTGYTGINPTECDIAVFRIYKKALTQAEITNNFNAIKGRFGL